MKTSVEWLLLLLVALLGLGVYEVHETRLAMRLLSLSASEIAQAEREDNYLWLHATTTDDWQGADGQHHGVTSEQRQGQTMRDWFDYQNRLVDAKIASKPLSFTPKGN